MEEIDKKWNKLEKRLEAGERQFFEPNLARLKRYFDALRHNLDNAKNVIDAPADMSDRERALLIAAVETGAAIDRSLEASEISKVQGNLLAMALEKWIREASDKKHGTH